MSNNETDKQVVLSPELAAHAAMLCFMQAQRLYNTLGPLLEANGRVEQYASVVDPESKVPTQHLNAVLEADENGVVTLTAPLPGAEGTTFDIRNGTLLVYQKDFGPPMYGYRLQVINGNPRWVMIHRWRREGFVNPQYPPFYADHLIEMLGQLFDYSAQDHSVDPQLLLQGTGWAAQALEGRDLNTLAGTPATQELTEAYVDLSNGLWNFTQVISATKLTTGDQIAAAKKNWIEMWDASLLKIRAALPSLH